MTSQEINEAVARKLGLLQEHECTYSDSCPGCDEVPDYCHSIEAAWEIMKRLDQRYECYLSVSANNYGFKVDDAITERQVAAAQADTAPMAICRAFLKLL